MQAEEFFWQARACPGLTLKARGLKIWLVLPLLRHRQKKSVAEDQKQKIDLGEDEKCGNNRIFFSANIFFLLRVEENRK